MVSVRYRTNDVIITVGSVWDSQHGNQSGTTRSDVRIDSTVREEMAAQARQVRPPLLSHTILTRKTGTKIHMYTNRGTNVPRTSLPCPPRYGNSTRRRFAKALGANHLLVYYRSGGGSTGLRQVRPPLLSHTILTRETGTKIHMNSLNRSRQQC